MFDDEIEGLFAVKSILRDSIDAKRVQMRDTKSYCGILLDDNNRKPICRLRFNQDRKYLGLFDAQKNEDRVAIENVDDIYKYAPRIVAIVKTYDNQFGVPAKEEAIVEIGTNQEQKATFTGKQAIAVHFQGKRYAIDSWKDGMLTIIELCRSQNPTKFEAVAPTMKGRKRPYITTNNSLLRAYVKIPNTNYFLETNLSSQMIAKFCYDLTRKMGYSENELEFETD